MVNLAIGLRNLAECLGQLGQLGPARDAAAEAVTAAQATGHREQIRNSHAYLGWAAGLAGDTAEAERQFTAADQIQVADDRDGDHLYSLPGAWWAEWLARTGRDGLARALTARNAEISRENGWNDDLARCDWMLGRLALAAGDTVAAGEHLAAAAGCFRDGDYLTELAVTLADLAGHARAAGTWTPPTGMRPRRSPSPPPAGWCPPRPPRWPPAPTSAPPGPPLPRTRTCCCRAATRPMPRCGGPATSWPGTNWTRCAPTPPSTTPRAATTGGPPKPSPARPAGPARPGPRPAGHRGRARRRQKAAEDGREGGEH